MKRCTMVTRGRTVVGFSLGLGLACTTPSIFVCDDSSQCTSGGTAGVCQDNGLCSFPDDECDSDQRYGEHAGPLSGTCVGDEPTTTGPVTSGTTSGVISAATSSGASDPSSLDETRGPPMTTSDGPDPDASLVFWLPMDSGSALLDDISGNGLHGECSACPTEAPGMLGGSAQFLDGAHVRIPYDDRMFTPDGFTVMLWVKPLELLKDRSYYVIHKGVGDSFFSTWSIELEDLDGDEDFEVRVSAGLDGNNSGAIVPGAVEVGKWTHIAARYDGELIEAWLDGQPVAVAPPPQLEFDSHDVIIGTPPNDRLGPFDGVSAWVDDVRLYDRALDADEIADAMNGQ